MRKVYEIRSHTQRPAFSTDRCCVAPCVCSAGSEYCDMAENVKPGYQEGTCTGDRPTRGQQQCNADSHSYRIGWVVWKWKLRQERLFRKDRRPHVPWDKKELYGPNKKINSMRPFEVEARVGDDGGLQISLSQDGGNTVTSFDSAMAGNPQGHGVPYSAKAATLQSMGKLVLVASLYGRRLTRHGSTDSATHAVYQKPPSCLVI